MNLSNSLLILRVRDYRKTSCRIWITEKGVAHSVNAPFLVNGSTQIHITLIYLFLCWEVEHIFFFFSFCGLTFGGGKMSVIHMLFLYVLVPISCCCSFHEIVRFVSNLGFSPGSFLSLAINRGHWFSW